MKKLIFILSIVAVAALAFVSCNKNKPLESISADVPSTMLVGETITLDVVYHPEDATEKPEAFWMVSDPTLAVIADGKLTAMREGQVELSVQAGVFGITYSIYILNDTPIEGTSYVSLIGTFLGTDWDQDYLLDEVETDMFVIKHVTLTDTDKFKIRFNGNWDYNRGATVENLDVELNQGFAVVEHGKDVLPHRNGTFDIWYNKEKEQMAVVEKDGQPVWAD